MIRIRVQNGVHIESGRFYVLIDPTRRPSRAPSVVLLTHAHRDHYSPSALRLPPKVPIVMSRATRLLVDRGGRLRNVVEVEPNGEVEVSGIQLRAHEAGHILGSLQFSFEVEGLTITYTGDFNLEKRIILKPAEIVKSEVLLIDATYGDPRYRFPPRTELYARLVEEVKRETEAGGRVLIKSRRLGVAQEVTAVISFSTHITPVVEETIARYNNFYEEFGEIIGRYVTGSAPGRGTAVIAGLGQRAHDYTKVLLCTGWALKKGLPLSSHADFDHIVSYVKHSGASVVVPFVGFRRTLAEYLKSEYGLEANYGEEVLVKP